MDTKQLKTKILDLAIRGKLLSPETLSELKKSPDYETADVLLKKLRAEKEEKISKGELKRDKKDSYIFVGDDNRHYEKFADGTEEEIEVPFEIPSSWSWCCGSEIFNPMKSKKPSGDTFEYIDIESIDNKKHRVIKTKILKVSEAPSRASREVSNGDILFSLVRPYLENIALINEEHQDCIASTGFYVCKPNKALYSKYLFLLMTSDYVVQGLNQFMKGDNSPSINGDDIAKWFYPIPPLAEQKRIAAEIEKIFSLIDSLETDKSAMQLAVKQAKSKILDLAIHGKLVPQDPADERASVLLEKLRAEKEAKIKAGELKRDKNDSYIYKSTTDNCHYEKFADGTEEEIEVPFELPDNWSWCHFGDIADVINGKNQSKVVDDNGLYPIYGSGGFMGRANDYICHENCTIIGRKGSINNPIFVEEKFWNVDTAFGLAPTSNVLPKYLFYFCKSFDFTTLDSSTTLPSLTKTNIQQILFPLPSLSEQQRIINKIENLFEYLDQIALNLV